MLGLPHCKTKTRRVVMTLEQKRTRKTRRCIHRFFFYPYCRDELKRKRLLTLLLLLWSSWREQRYDDVFIFSFLSYVRNIVAVSSKRWGSKRTRQIRRNPFAVCRAKKGRPSSIWRARNAAGTVPTAHNTRQDDVLINKNNTLIRYNNDIYCITVIVVVTR